MTEAYGTYELPLGTPDGGRHTGRVTGRLIAEDERNGVRVFETADERVIVHDENKLEHHELNDASLLRDWLSEDEQYIATRGSWARRRPSTSEGEPPAARP